MFTQFLRDRGIDRVPGRGGKPWAIAHRGYSGAVPENTMAAIDAARALEADFIEIDVHLSADGTPLVLHDPTLNRTTDASGAVANLSDEQISLADAGSWLGPGFAGQRIPHLDAVLYSMSFRGGWLLQELKGDWEAGGVAAVVDLITQHGMADRVVLQSFSQHTLHNCQAIAGHIPRILLRVVPKEGDVELVQRLEGIGYAPSFRGFKSRRELVEEIRELDLCVNVHTVDAPEGWDALLSAGVSGIITNQLGRLQGYLTAKFDV